MIEIKSRWTEDVLFTAESQTLKSAVELAVEMGADLNSADLLGVDLRGSNLRGAKLRDSYLALAKVSGSDLAGSDFSGADLSRADFSGADFSGAYLRKVDFRGTNLSRANFHLSDITGAKMQGAALRNVDFMGCVGMNRLITTPLYSLKDQVGRIRAYKLTKTDGTGVFYPPTICRVGKTYTEEANSDEQLQCAPGISLATLDWCIKEWCEGYRIFVAEFTATDIAAIPVGSDGKFRVSRCKIVAEKDLKELGLT